MGRSIRSSSLLVFLVTLLALGALASAQKPLSHEEARALDHQNPVWESVRAHLPDPGTVSRASGVGSLFESRCLSVIYSRG